MFLDDVDLALVVFDPTHRQDPLKGVEFWLKQLFYKTGHSCHVILVGARIDRGSLTLTTEEMEKFCIAQQVLGGHILTSARSGEGIEELMERVKASIPWDRMAATITTSTFKRIKEYVLNLKEGVKRGSILVTPSELRRQLTEQDSHWEFSDAEMMTAVKLLANHGYVMLLHGLLGEESILLTPDLLTNLASSFLLEARRNPKGLGVLDEERVLKGDYPFPELRDLTEREQEILLDAASILFLQHHVCFRETLGTQTFLIFPSLINQKRPLLDELETLEGYSYIATGAVETVYPALVVLLGYTNTFTRTNQWQNQAEYEMHGGEICGFRLVQEHEGEVELVLYYGKDVPPHACLLFQGLFEKFLRNRDIVVTKYPPILCPECGYRQERSVVVKRIRSQKKFMHCDECGEKIWLPSEGDEITLSRRDRAKLEQERILARLRTTFETALVRIKGFIRDASTEKRKFFPTCFISYAWGDPENERWVARLAGDLKNAGITVLLDQVDNSKLGSNVSRFISEIEKSDFIVVVGTPMYLQKYEDQSSGSASIVAAEADLINQRLLSTEDKKQTVIPIIREGDEWKSLTPLLRGRVFGDFRYEESYFASLFDLILTLFRIPYDHTAFKDVREVVRSNTLLLTES